MQFNFTDRFPAELKLQAAVISGPDSFHKNEREYLMITQSDGAESWYEIKYAVHCSPFKQAIVIDHILAVGHEAHFYLFDLLRNTHIAAIEMTGYFGHLYYNMGFFYITDAEGLICMDKRGALQWQNKNLAIDGVIINDFLENSIAGCGEWDPPGGWRDFILDLETGNYMK